MATETTAQKWTLEKARAAAQEYMRETGCRWAEACLEIKRRHPETRALFGAPTVEDLDQNR